MYYQVVSQCVQSLKNVEGLLDKADQFASAKQLDVRVLLNGRLAPDMKPLDLPGAERLRLCQSRRRLAFRADASKARRQ